MKYLILIAVLLSAPAYAVEPGEILPNPALETRARAISKELRCLVCRNENIDSSNADIAKDLRVLVRERLVIGDTDAQVMAYVVDRYGEFVLLKPPFTARNMLLWLAGPLMLLIGLFASFRFIKNPAKAEQDSLSASEEQRLQALLDE